MGLSAPGGATQGVTPEEGAVLLHTSPEFFAQNPPHGALLLKAGPPRRVAGRAPSQLVNSHGIFPLTPRGVQEWEGLKVGSLQV